MKVRAYRRGLVPGLVLLALLSAAALAWWWLAGQDRQALPYRTARIERGPLAATVSASGVVNPVSQVTVGTQVSGQIKDLFVDFNTEVRAGQLIAQIDPETFEYRVRQAQADVDAARANVLTAQAGLLSSQAALSRVQVESQEAVRELERKQALVERQFIASIEADRARALVRTSDELVKSARAQVGVSEAQVTSARAIVAQREAQLAQARVDLGRTRITSPVNGIVIKRAVEKGQTVAASLQSPELFVIARNLQDMQVDASIDESDVGRIRTGQRASFSVDAFPGQTFEGTVTQVRKAAQTVANVVTYVAVVQFANAGGRLLPGMTANVRVVTEQRDSVLKVPNAALRVRVAGVEPEATAGGAEAGGVTGGPGGAAEGAGPSSGPSSSPPGAGKSSQGLRAPAVKARPQDGPLDPVSASPAPATSVSADVPTPPGGVAPALPAGGPMVENRNRLVAELKMDAAQAARLDAIYESSRPRFMALRDLPAEERTKARERISADVRARIVEILTPAQKARFAAMAAEAASRPVARGRLYLLGDDGRPRAYHVRLGITDGSMTEVMVPPGSPLAEVIKEGATVITAVVGGGGGATPRPPSGPRLPF